MRNYRSSDLHKLDFMGLSEEENSCVSRLLNGTVFEPFLAGCGRREPWEMHPAQRVIRNLMKNDTAVRVAMFMTRLGELCMRERNTPAGGASLTVDEAIRSCVLPAISAVWRDHLDAVSAQLLV
jgi:hypothetical protein